MDGRRTVTDLPPLNVLTWELVLIQERSATTDALPRAIRRRRWDCQVAPAVHRWEGEAFVWLLKFWPGTDLEVLGIGHKIVKGSIAD